MDVSRSWLPAISSRFRGCLVSDGSLVPGFKFANLQSKILQSEEFSAGEKFYPCLLDNQTTAPLEIFLANPLCNFGWFVGLETLQE